ncbi:MAG TPA: hypothetical protein VGO57_14375 [Verrucomicrobiae bacterium]|jgi:hypothetical protein
MTFTEISLKLFPFGGFGRAATKVVAERSVRRRTIAHPTAIDRHKVPVLPA